MANNRQQVNQIITSNFNPVPNPITAQRHRLVETAMLDYTAGQILLGGMSDNIIDSQGADTILVCSFGTITLPNTEYMVVGHLVSFRGGDGWNADNDVVWTVVTKTVNGFRVYTAEWDGTYQQVGFSYIVISTPGINLPTTW